MSAALVFCFVILDLTLSISGNGDRTDQKGIAKHTLYREAQILSQWNANSTDMTQSVKSVLSASDRSGNFPQN